MPPSGSFETTNISSILNSVSVILARNMDNMIWDDLVEFQRDPSIRTRDIPDSVDKVRLETEFKQNLLPESGKLKSCYCSLGSLLLLLASASF